MENKELKKPESEMTGLEKREAMFKRMSENSWELEQLMKQFRIEEKERKIREQEKVAKEEYEKKFKTFNLFKEEKNGTDNSNI